MLSSQEDFSSSNTSLVFYDYHIDYGLLPNKGRRIKESHSLNMHNYP